jgi:hypothetical protein
MGLKAKLFRSQVLAHRAVHAVAVEYRDSRLIESCGYFDQALPAVTRLLES